MNEGRVLFFLRDVHGQLIRDDVRFDFVNQTLRERDRRIRIRLNGEPVKLKLPAQPNGLYQVFLSPERYRRKSKFLNVSGHNGLFATELFLQPEKARPRFPDYPELPKLLRKTIGPDDFQQLAPLQKASLLNIHAKLQDEELFGYFWGIEWVEQDRVYARVDPRLLSRARADSRFHQVSGALHDVPDGFERVGSYKTHERVGNLQLTFFRDSELRMVVDADIDDHRGLRHAFDVLRHRLTGEDTHPYDIHQVLVHFQGIHPGYELS